MVKTNEILNVLYPEPVIQEALLVVTMPSGRDPIVLRDLQPIAAELDWGKQQEMWVEMAGLSTC